MNDQVGSLECYQIGEESSSLSTECERDGNIHILGSLPQLWQ